MRPRLHSVAIGALVTALLLSGLFVGVSQGVTGPTTIRLTFGDVLAEHTHPLRDEHGLRTASITFVKGRLADEDGTGIGRHRSECTSADNVGTWCTHTLVLQDGPYTDAGTITVTGLFKGFTGEESAVVGGTGAYQGADGSATATVEGDAFIVTVSLP
jgi:dirigent-like protein